MVYNFTLINVMDLIFKLQIKRFEPQTTSMTVQDLDHSVIQLEI